MDFPGRTAIFHKPHVLVQVSSFSSQLDLSLNFLWCVFSVGSSVDRVRNTENAKEEQTITEEFQWRRNRVCQIAISKHLNDSDDSGVAPHTAKHTYRPTVLTHQRWSRSRRLWLVLLLLHKFWLDHHSAALFILALRGTGTTNALVA